MLHDDKPSLDELTHFGVKGMKWGVHKADPNSREGLQRQLKKVVRKQNRLNTNSAFDGYALRNHQLNKMNVKRENKDPSFSYAKLSDSEKAKYQDKASGKAKRASLVAGVGSAAVIFAVGSVAVASLGASSKTTRQGQIAMGMLSANELRTSLMEVRAIGLSQKHQKNVAERMRLEKALNIRG